MASSKHRRQDAQVAPDTPIAWTLPADLLLEIAARSAHDVLLRFASSCKLLRRDILSPSFILRVSHRAAPPCILALCTHENNCFALLHPATPAASIRTDHLFPFFLRHTAGLFDGYSVVTSRRGLVLLQRFFRRHVSLKSQNNSAWSSDMCIYDPISGSQTFLSRPRLNTSNSIQSYHNYTLLTADDGIDASFLLIVADFDRWGIKVQTASSCGTWKRVMYVRNHDELSWWSVNRHCDTAVLHGGVIHWLLCHDKPILSYDLVKRKLGSVKLPPTNCEVRQVQLATSSDGKLLKLLAIEGFVMSVWLRVPISLDGGSGWSLETMVDMEEKLRSLCPDIPPNGPCKPIVFDESKTRSGDVVLLHVPVLGYDEIVIIFSLRSKDMHRNKCKYGTALLEIDLHLVYRI